MTHVPETGSRQNGVDLWRRFLGRLSWVLVEQPEGGW